ncbi:MAG: 1-phosphofructokinase [Dehalococcoidia bacterium]|nr:MAG: 1-phosphofructokinase [Dehalococcoidia bacterium]
MIATITLNPTIDRTISVHGLVLDEANRWTNLRLYAGGKGIDVSRAIHEMGGKTTAYGFIGGDTGRTVEILLDEEGVPFSFTPIGRETRTNFIITDTKASRQTRIDAPGPRISERELERFRQKIGRIDPKPALMVIGGSVPPGIPPNIYYDIVTECKDFGIRCILDSEGQWLMEGIKAKPYLIKPNVREAEGLLDTKLPTEEAIIKAALNLVEMNLEIAVVSRGKDGIIAATKERIVKAVPPPVKVRSAVGAGDCTIAGLALKLAGGESLIEACRLAAAMGTAAVLTPGTELCHRADVEELLPQIEVSETTTKQRAKTYFTAP